MVTEYQLRVQAMLVRHAADFRDFDFDDVLPEMTQILGPREIAQIQALESCAEQNELLFFYLSLDPLKVNDFIEAIKQKYKWIAQPMERSLKDESNTNDLKDILKKIRVLHSYLPRLTDYNVHRMTYVSIIYSLIVQELKVIILISFFSFSLFRRHLQNWNQCNASY